MKYLIAVMIALLPNLAVAGAMDRNDCLNGPISFQTGVAGAIDSIDKRVVACFNYSNSIEIENHNDQSRYIQILESRIMMLETRLIKLEQQSH